MTLDRLRNVLDIIAVFLIDFVVIVFLTDRYTKTGLLFAFFAIAFLAGWYARKFTRARS